MKHLVVLLFFLPITAIAGGFKHINKDDTSALNFNFDRIRNEELNTVHKAGTEVITGAKTFTGALSVRGTTTSDSAAIGYLGEYKSSATVILTDFPTSGQWGDLLLITLTAGDWDLTGIISAKANGATVTSVDIGISSVAGNMTPGTEGDSYVTFWIPTAATNSSGTLPALRQSIASTTTFYLKYFSTYAVSVPQAVGRISARRIR